MIQYCLNYKRHSTRQTILQTKHSNLYLSVDCVARLIVMCKGEIDSSGGFGERIQTEIMDKEDIISEGVMGIAVSCVVGDGVVVLFCNIFLIMEIATAAYWRMEIQYIVVQVYDQLLTF